MGPARIRCPLTAAILLALLSSAEVYCGASSHPAQQGQAEEVAPPQASRGPGSQAGTPGACPASLSLVHSPPKWRMPAEWEPHNASWMGWPKASQFLIHKRIENKGEAPRVC